MIRHVSHTVVRVAVLTLMTLSVLGFTTVIDYCSMSDSSACCCSIEHNNHATPTTPGPSLGNEKISCDVQIVVGGPTPVALNSFPEASATSPVLNLVAFDQGLCSFPDVHHLIPVPNAVDVQHPKVDIYIRSGALLI